MNPDVVNGLFEFLGCFFIGISVRKVYRDKKVAGVSWIHVSFWSLWGAWNLFYYPHLNQWWSFWGGMGVTSINTLYVAQLIYYGEAQKLRQTIKGILRPW